MQPSWCWQQCGVLLVEETKILDQAMKDLSVGLSCLPQSHQLVLTTLWDLYHEVLSEKKIGKRVGGMLAEDIEEYNRDKSVDKAKA